MQAHRLNIDQRVQALRKDWSFLEPLEVPAEAVKDRSAVFVRHLKENDEAHMAYVKIYANKKHPFQRLFRRGRSRTEVRNLLFFKSLGIATPEVLAWGERRNRWGKQIQDFIITRAIPQTVTLEEYLQSGEASAKARLELARDLGNKMKILHQHHFYHKDIHFRNILVPDSDSRARLYFIDCPRGRFHTGLRPKKHWQLKDLGILDKYASVLCSNRERIAFLENYLDLGRDTVAFARTAKEIESFRRKRYDNRKGRRKVVTANPPNSSP